MPKRMESTIPCSSLRNENPSSEKEDMRRIFAYERRDSWTH